MRCAATVRGAHITVRHPATTAHENLRHHDCTVWGRAAIIVHDVGVGAADRACRAGVGAPCRGRSLRAGHRGATDAAAEPRRTFSTTPSPDDPDPCEETIMDRLEHHFAVMQAFFGFDLVRGRGTIRYDKYRDQASFEAGANCGATACARLPNPTGTVKSTIAFDQHELDPRVSHASGGRAPVLLEEGVAVVLTVAGHDLRRNLGSRRRPSSPGPTRYESSIPRSTRASIGRARDSIGPPVAPLRSRAFHAALSSVPWKTRRRRCSTLR